MDEKHLAALTGVLETLWRAGVERPDKPCTLAWLSKRSGCPMSALRRQLTVLSAAGWVTVLLDERGTGSVALSAAGRQLAATLWGRVQT